MRWRRPKSREQDLERELRDHLELEAEEQRGSGLGPEQARYAALRAFGNVTSTKEEVRQMWGFARWDILVQDLRYAFRNLRKSPGFAATAILTLALGIGMTTAVFSVVNSVLLRPLVYPHPERLVWLADYSPQLKRDGVESTDFYAWRERARSYSAMAALSYAQPAVAAAGSSTQATGVAIGGDFWQLTGARPALGRLFEPGERNAIVFSWNFFEQFGADATMVGKPVTVDGRQATLAGVLPRDFRFQFPVWWLTAGAEPAEIYVPLPPRSVPRMVTVAAALRSGVSPAQALAELEAIEARILAEDSSHRSLMTRLHVEPLQARLTAGIRQTLWVLFAAGGFLLLIACVNVASLLLARASLRRHEIAVRVALGARRVRLAQQLFVESLTLAALGGTAGLLLARWMLAAFVRLAPYAVPRLADTGIDNSVLAFTAGISLVTALLCGLAPARLLSRTDPIAALHEGVRSSDGLHGLRTRRLFVILELASATILLSGAGLMLKSSWQMHAYAPGFAPERTLILKIRLAGAHYEEQPSEEAYLREVVQRVQSQPGVEASGVSTWYLFSGIPAFPTDTNPKQTHVVRFHAVSPGYPRAMGMRLVKGRWLAERDIAGVVLLNESMAREAFGGADPVGRTLSLPRPVTVIGVVADLKYSKLDTEPPPEVFVPYQQGPLPGPFEIAVRPTGSAEGLAGTIRSRISGIDPSQPIFDVQTLEQALADSIAPWRFDLFLMEIFALAGLILAVIGIYGVVAYSVGARTREIGLRMALGAQRGSVMRMVIGEGAITTLAGIAAGLLAAQGLTRLMGSLLYGVQPNDPAVFTAAPCALAAVALLACWVPALKAARSDPTKALHHE